LMSCKGQVQVEDRLLQQAGLTDVLTWLINRASSAGTTALHKGLHVELYGYSA
jgi:methylaspartate ammonia-lyase